MPRRRSVIYMHCRSTWHPKLAGSHLALPSTKAWECDGVKSVSIPLSIRVLRQGKTRTNMCGFNVARPAYHLFNRLSTPILIRSLRPPLMSLNRERYRVFETLAPDEEEWSKREELFNAHGYNFRPRLRKGWTPSWHTTGENPLYSEDGEILKVLRPLDNLILHIDKFVDPPC